MQPRLIHGLLAALAACAQMTWATLVWPDAPPRVQVHTEERFERHEGDARIPLYYHRIGDKRAVPWPLIVQAAGEVHRDPTARLHTYTPVTIDRLVQPDWCGVILLEPHGATWRGGRLVRARIQRGATAFEASRCPPPIPALRPAPTP